MSLKLRDRMSELGRCHGPLLLRSPNPRARARSHPSAKDRLAETVRPTASYPMDAKTDPRIQLTVLPIAWPADPVPIARRPSATPLAWLQDLEAKCPRPPRPWHCRRPDREQIAR